MSLETVLICIGVLGLIALGMIVYFERKMKKEAEEIREWQLEQM